MKPLCEKIYLELDMPNENDTLGDKDRIINALKDKYENITMPYKIVKKLYPMCRENNFKITVTILKRQYDWVVTNVEGKDTSNCNYGIAVDLGSTTITMQLINLNNKQVIAQESTFNKQVK